MTTPAIGAALALGIVAVSLASCRHAPDPREVRVTNDGAVCLGSLPDAGAADGGATTPAGIDLHADEALAISVRSPCLSNVCATQRGSKCSVKRDGDRLLVTSELTWLGPEDIGVKCPFDCTFLEASCKTDPLPAGNYKVMLGAREVDVTLPSHLAVRCDRDKPPVVAVLAPPPPVEVNLPPDPAAVPAVPGTGVVPTPPPGDVLCIGPADGNQARVLKKGGGVAFTLLHKNPCLGSACTKAPGKCTVKRKGFELTVDAQFPASNAKPVVACTEDCTAIAATCKTGALPVGTYNVTIGQQKRTVVIPSPSPGCQ